MYFGLLSLSIIFCDLPGYSKFLFASSLVTLTSKIYRDLIQNDRKGVTNIWCTNDSLLTCHILHPLLKTAPAPCQQTAFATITPAQLYDRLIV